METETKERYKTGAAKCSSLMNGYHGIKKVEGVTCGLTEEFYQAY